MLLSYKQIAKQEHISLATAYRRYPPPKPQVTQVDVIILRFHGYSFREVAAILGITKDMAWRLAR